jgi:hypothetical protein
MNMSTLKACSLHAVACVVACIALCVTPASAVAQSLLLPGQPGKNVNIIGPTPNIQQIPDILLRQQNEPACTVRPENHAYILCAYNDYRATDFPFVQGDSWIGVSMSADFGKTWFSRLAPGFKSHKNSLGLQFAADPNLVSVPGNSPGIAVLSYIAASRDLDDGKLVVQRWAASDQEDVNYYVAEDSIFTVDLTNSGRFADKPTLLAVVDPPHLQTTQTITMRLEDGTQIDRDVPSGRLVLCYSIFTGSNSSKIICKVSLDWGVTWSKDNKISEEQVRVQGVALTNIGHFMVASWRRADSNKGIGNAIMSSISTDGGNSWTKAREATGLCPIDQLATSAQIRMLDFPWMANDGERVYIFASDRRFGGDGDCATGIPKIAMTWSTNGRNWSPLQPLDVGNSSPYNEPSADGFQYIPTAVGYRGNVQVAWYDTRREGLAAPLPPTVPAPMQDYLADDFTIVNRKADVYTVRIRANDSGQPQISPSIRVSRYNQLIFNKNGDPFPVPVETEGHFPNTPIFEKGTRSFNGDYTSAAVASFRKDDAEGPWIENSLSTGSPATDREDVWISWGDGRDLRGNYLPKFDGVPSPFTPNENAQDMPIEVVGELRPEQDIEPGEKKVTDELLAESVADSAVDLGPGKCVPGQDRTRDSNVYGSLLRSVSEFQALTASKPLTGFQRTYPILLTNPDPSLQRKFLLRIASQPPDYGALGSPVPFSGLASWNQLPSKPPFNPDAEQDELTVTVTPQSSAARTLFLVSNVEEAEIEVEMFDVTCPVDEPDCEATPVFLRSITVGGGDLQESQFCQNNPGTDTCVSVDEFETHDPELLTPDLISPDLISARLLSPDLISPDLISPDLISPDLISPDLISPDLISPDLISPDLISPDLISPDLISPDLISPDLISPDLISPDLISATEPAYQDITYTLQNTGNVTTTYSADMSFNDPGFDLQAQLIIWTAHMTGTSRDCAYALIADNQILAAKNLTDEEIETISLPTVQSPFAGPVSFVARPGQVVYATLRVFGDKSDLDGLSPSDYIAATGFGVSAHACNDPENIDPNDDCLTIGFEKILVDKTGPSFVGIKDGDTIPEDPIEADRIGGACIDLTGGTNPLVKATDTSGIKSLGCSLVSTGQPICSTSEAGLSIPVMSDPSDPTTATQVLCTAIDNRDNETTVQIGIAVADRTAPTISGTPTLEANADPGTGTALLALEVGLVATDDPLVDPDPVLSCTATAPALSTPAISGETVGPGTYSVSCFATDDSNNLSAEFTYTLTVVDNTPPVLTGVPDNIVGEEATGPEGAIVTYDGPTASDTAGDATVSCSPASGATFSLGTTTVTCTATDDGGNTAEATFTVEVVDTTPPTVETPNSDVLVAVDSSGSGSLDFESQVTATDLVDPNPVVECTATGGAGNGSTSGDPLPIGETEVTCTATDASNNEASGTYTVRVEFGSSFGIDFPKGGVKAGSTVPSTFGWLDAAGNRIDSSDANPVVTARSCDTNEVVLDPGEFPGNSDLRWDASLLEWKFNWQTVFPDGTPIPGGLYCVQVFSSKTGQVIPDGDPDGTRIRVRD